MYTYIYRYVCVYLSIYTDIYMYMYILIYLCVLARVVWIKLIVSVGPTHPSRSFHGSMLPRSYAVVRAEKDGGGAVV